MNRREMFVVKPVLERMYRDQSGEKSRWQLRIEGWLWRFAGQHALAKIFKESAR